MRRALLLPLLLLALAACDADDSLFAEFEATVQAGPDVETVEGDAVYAVVDGADGPRLVIGLFDGDLVDSDRDDYDFIAFHRDGGLPSVGAYAVTADPQSGRAVSATYADVEEADDARDARGPVVRGTSGTLTITSVDGLGVLTGVFRFEGEGFRVEAPESRLDASARGRFEAFPVSPDRLRALGVGLLVDETAEAFVMADPPQLLSFGEGNPEGPTSLPPGLPERIGDAR